MQRYVGPASLLSLLWAGFRLDAEVYRTVSRDRDATHQCIAVTLLAAIARGFELSPQIGLTPMVAILLAMAIAFAGLLGESAIVWMLGAKALGRAAGYGAVLRPLALAAAPGILYVVVTLAGSPAPLSIAVSAWLLVAFVVAIRAALDTGVWLTIGVAVAVRAVETGIDALVQRL